MWVIHSPFPPHLLMQHPPSPLFDSLPSSASSYPFSHSLFSSSPHVFISPTDAPQKIFILRYINNICFRLSKIRRNTRPEEYVRIWLLSLSLILTYLFLSLMSGCHLLQPLLIASPSDHPHAAHLQQLLSSGSSYSSRVMNRMQLFQIVLMLLTLHSHNRPQVLIQKSKTPFQIFLFFSENQNKRGETRCTKR